jgi:hypothetical protein
MNFSFGFEFDGIRYGWHKRSLYRLPHEKSGKTFALRKIMAGRIGVTTVYSIGGKKRTIGNLKTITVKVDWSVNNFINQDVP